MLQTFHIKNFRGFKDLELGPLKRINLLLGQNNTGKTAVLEALAVLLSRPPSACGNLPTLFRPPGGNTTEDFWKWLFFNKNLELSIELRATFDNQPEFGVLLQKGTPPPDDFHKGRLMGPLGRLGGVPCYPLGGRQSADLKCTPFSILPRTPRQNALDYNRMILKRKKKQVEALLKCVEPALEAIESLQTGQEPLLYADVGLSEMIPVTQLGQGFNRLLEIYSEMLADESKVLLIDEIENGLHHSVLSTVWRGIFEAANELDLQVFATTHSWECVMAADEIAREKSPYQLGLVRLDRVEGAVKATVIDEKTLNTAKELEWEMR